MKTVLIVVLALVALCSGQGFQDLFFIDDFSVNSPTQVIVIPSNPTFPITRFVQTQSSTIVGGERDIFLQCDGGGSALLMSASVSGGNYTASTPNGARGFSTLTYDGTDTSTNLDTSGLIGSGFSNWRANGGFALRVSMRTDVTSTVVFKVYSGSASSVCTHTQQVVASNSDTVYLFEFDSDWTGNCDFSNVGALDINFNQPDNVDIILQFLSIYAPIPTTPSPTPSPTRTRTPTPTPTLSDVCVCFCPDFTCELIRHDDVQVFFFDFIPFFDDFVFFNNVFFFFNFDFFFTGTFFDFFSDFFDFWYWFDFFDFFNF